MALKYKKNSLAIIIPMLNEEKVASKCIEEVIKEIKKIKNDVLLIVVDDGSRDKTSSILKIKSRKYKKELIILTHEKNLGFGGALQTGIKEAIKRHFEFYLTMDSDLTNPPIHIHEFVSSMKPNIDCVKASRYIKGGGVENVPYFRQVISVTGNLIASKLFNVGIRDCTNGFKMVRLKMLENIEFKEKNFSIILEELYYLKKKKAKFSEIPNTIHVRKNSKSHFKYTPKIFYDYFKYVLKSAFA